MINSLQEEKLTSEDGRVYGQMAMDISALAIKRPMDAVSKEYQQIEMSVMNGMLNTNEMIKHQVGVTGDTIHMGSISVYPPASYSTELVESTSDLSYGGVVMPADNVQPYYDPYSGMMYMPMYPVQPYPQPVDTNMVWQGNYPIGTRPMAQPMTHPTTHPMAKAMTQPMTQPMTPRWINR